MRSRGFHPLNSHDATSPSPLLRCLSIQRTHTAHSIFSNATTNHLERTTVVTNYVRTSPVVRVVSSGIYTRTQFKEDNEPLTGMTIGENLLRQSQHPDCH